MSGATFLTRVVIESYKSIAACDVRLGPLTFLVGPNGSGKSNFLDALRFVSDALTTSLEGALRTRGGGAEICHVPNRSRGAFGLRLEFTLPSGATGHYAFRVGQRANNGQPGRWEVINEEWRVRPREEGAPVVEGGGDPAAQVNTRLALVHAAGSPQVRPLYDALVGMRFYQIVPSTIATIQTLSPGEHLRNDGSNLASVLARLQFADSDTKDRIDEYLRVILPGLVKVRVEPIQDVTGRLPTDVQRIALIFEQIVGKTVELFWASQMSDGTLRALGILVALLQAMARQGPKPPLVGIEEPEAQVNPAVMRVLLDAATEASYSTQVIVTTQSPDLLDDKDVPTETVLAVTSEAGQTAIGPIDEASRSVIQKRLYTVGELLRIGQLAPEPCVAPRPVELFGWGKG